MKAASLASTGQRASGREDRSFRVGNVDVFPSTGRINGQGGNRKLDPKVIEVLLRLAMANGGIVSKEALMADVWPGVVVTDFAVSRCIYQLRKNLGKAAGVPDSPIETLPKRGYRLVWPVTDKGPGQIEGLAPARLRSLYLTVMAVILALTALLALLSWKGALHHTTRPAIAVMAFSDLSPSGDLGYFGDGIATALRMELGRSREIDVIARTSSDYFRDHEASIQEIGTALDADYLVEGSVNRESDALQITAALVHAADGRLVWSKAFEYASKGAFTSQQGIATAIASYLDVSLANPREHGGTDDFGALDAYLHGVGTDDPELAEMQADLALARDPEYADALILKASAIYLALWHGIGVPERAWAEAQPLLQRAMAIAGESSEAYVLIGGFAMWREDFAEAETALKRALEINPSNSYAYVHLSRLMERTGRVRDAVRLATRNARLDPLNPFRHLQLANRQWTAGDYESGRASFERALELDPLNYATWKDYAQRLADREGVDAGLRLVARLQRSPEFRAMFVGPQPRISAAGVGLFAQWFSFMGDYERERQMLELQSRLGDNSNLHRELGWLYINLGDLEHASREAWAAIGGMPRESIANRLIATVALRSRKGVSRALNHYREYWPGLSETPPDVTGCPASVAIEVALIRHARGELSEATGILSAVLARDDLEDDSRAIALAHLGDFDLALSALEQHYRQGGYFDYVQGDPFWEPLANEPRFEWIVREEAAKDRQSRWLVHELTTAGELVLPGQQLQ
ncbi:MAG: winged helix-turn-helix domain-containing protein [Lysobacterales bacterium]